MKGLVVFMLLAICGSASAQNSETWEASRQTYGAFAGTTNASGEMLGYVCYTEAQNCLFVVSVSHECKVGAAYPVMINANTGALSIELGCVKVNGVNFMTFQNFELMSHVVKSNPRVGIAFPMENGTFVVMRFNLAGSSQAMSTAEQFVVEAGKGSTRTQVL